MLLEKDEIDWHNFGNKFRYKLKRDGSIITEVMDLENLITEKNES